MSLIARRLPSALATLFGASAALLLGCSDSPANLPAGPSGTPAAVSTPSVPAPVRSELTVCKFGSDASFSLTVNNVAAGGFSLTDGQCALVYTNTGAAATVTVAEASNPNTVLDSLVTVRIRGALNDSGTVNTITSVTGNSATVKVGLEFGAVLAFYNTPLVGSIGDFVWNDLDRDGVQDAGEPGIAGVTVNLFDCSNTPLASTTTDGSGNYLFSGLVGGCYTVGFLAPSGFVFSPANQGGNSALDSDANPATGLTGAINLLPGQNDLTWDAGLNVPPPPVGGQGCSPGYWKQSQHFHSYTAPLTPNTLFSSVFENAFPGKTLLQVLSTGGGGLDALGRQVVAALLNSANGSVNYDLTTSQVISQFNAVYPGTKAAYTTLQNTLENFNSFQFCPLN